MGLMISTQMELPMNRIKILNKTGEIPVEKSVDEIDTFDDLRVIASAGSDAVKGTNPSQWLVVFIAVMAVIIVVPILPIALAYLAGHYCNWWASNNLNERK